VAIGYGPTDRLRDGIVHIAVYEKHVNLGFNQGAHLPDPAGLLAGTGRNVRHIPMKSVADVERPPVREYVRRARESAVSTEPGPARGVQSAVKKIYARRKRPVQ
jgi:hypothetical protein